MIVPQFNSLDETPWTLVFLLHMGAVYKSYSELSDDMRPPKKIWTNNELITEWFESKKTKPPANENTKVYTR